MKINLRGKRGFTTVDFSIAMIVIIIFVVIMTSISNSVYMSSMEAKRTAVALNYAVDIFEHIGEVNFDEVVASTNLLAIESLKDIEYEKVTTENGADIIVGKIGTYKINLRIKDYKGDQVVKIITLKITYPVSKNKTETIEMKRIKTIKKQLNTP